MKAMAIAILTPIITGLLFTLTSMYTDIQKLNAKAPFRDDSIERIEEKVDKLIDFHINNNDVKILKRGK